MKSRYALLASILLGILAVVGIKRMLDDQAKRFQTQEEPVKLLVASRHLEEGMILKNEDLVESEIPRRFFHPSLVTPKDLQTVLAKRLRTPILRGGFLRTVDVEEQQVYTRAPAIPSGKRLFTIQVDLHSGVGGRLKPGSMIDVIAILRDAEDPASARPGGGGGGARNAAQRAVTLLERVSVFTVGPQGFARTGYTLETGQYTAVTLVVSPTEAELLAYAQAQGKLLLVERDALDAVVGILASRGVSPANFEEILARLRSERR